MDTNALITKNESLFFIFYTLPTLYFLSVSFVAQIKNFQEKPHSLRGLKLTMIFLRGTIFTMVLSILVYNILNYFGVSTSDSFLDLLPYMVSTMLLLVSIILWVQWRTYGKD